MAKVLQYYIQSCAHLCVNPIMKFIYTLCECKCIIFIYICVSVKPCKFILWSVKRCKCKKIYIYIVLWGPIKQCIWQIFTLASCKCKRFGLVSVNHLHLHWTYTPYIRRHLYTQRWSKPSFALFEDCTSSIVLCTSHYFCCFKDT
jgi:hypothetical protein